MKVNNSKNDQNIFYEAISLLEDICSKEQLEKLKKNTESLFNYF